jgi:signal transduction histidine kinase
MKPDKLTASNLRRPGYPFGASIAYGLRNPLVPSPDAAASLERSRLANLRLRRRRVSMSSVIEECVEMTGPFVRGRGQTLSVTVESQPMELEADAARLCQVLQHLIVNATKFSIAGAEIGIRAKRDGADVIVVVTDVGAGIEAQRIGSIFGVYLQRHAADTARRGGLGIGLHVARALAEAHGGTLTAKSAGTGFGSEFTLRVPCLGFETAASALLQPFPSNRSVSALTAA